MASKEKINELIHFISRPPSLNIYISGIPPYPYELEGKLSLEEILNKRDSETKPNKLYKSIPWLGIEKELNIAVPSPEKAEKLICFLFSIR